MNLRHTNLFQLFLMKKSVQLFLGVNYSLSLSCIKLLTCKGATDEG